jgi:hypothetical protein
VRREWEPEDLVAVWTLVEQDEVAYKRGPTSLGFALLLKYFEMEGRFPRHVGELPPAAIGFVARQVGVDSVELAGHEWSGRTFEYHRAQIRRARGFRRFGEDDEAKLGGWLRGAWSAGLARVDGGRDDQRDPNHLQLWSAIPIIPEPESPRRRQHRCPHYQLGNLYRPRLYGA